jgi:hypothetical protein
MAVLHEAAHQFALTAWHLHIAADDSKLLDKGSSPTQN